MTTHTLTPLENTLHTTNAWLNELMGELGWCDRHGAYHALRVVLHALRDRLTIEEATDLGAQLPMLIRGLYYEGWHPSGKPPKEHRKDEFLAPVTAAFRDEAGVDPERIAWAVFRVLQHHVSAGEIEDVKNILPAAVRALWPESEDRPGS
jgi:uncharacterized protein (DUF2267 family)